VTAPDDMRQPLDLAVTNARIATTGEPRNIGVRAGRVVAVTTAEEDLGPARQQVDAAGRWVIPGAIDTHSHMGELAPEYGDLPGLSRESNFAYETRGAIAGGVTTALNYAKFGQGSMVPRWKNTCEPV